MHSPKSITFGERLKNNSYSLYSMRFVNKYFWRTKQQQEIDYVEEADGSITGYEFKWNAKAKAKILSNFVEACSADVQVISKDNFRAFIGLE